MLVPNGNIGEETSVIYWFNVAALCEVRQKKLNHKRLRNDQERMEKDTQFHFPRCENSMACVTAFNESL